MSKEKKIDGDDSLKKFIDREKGLREMRPYPIKAEAPIKQSNEEVLMTIRKVAVLMAALVLACFLMMLDIAIVGTAIPRITSRFHSLGWWKLLGTIDSRLRHGILKCKVI